MLIGPGDGYIFFRSDSMLRFDQQSVPDLDHPVIDRGMRNQDQRGHFPLHRRLQDARPGVPGVIGHWFGAGGQRLVPGRQDLTDHMAREFVLEPDHIDAAMDWAEVTLVGHIVEDFLGVAGQLAQLIDLPLHPGRIFIIFERWHIVVWRAALAIVPHPDAARPFDHLPALETCCLGDRRGRIGNIVALAIRTKPPAMVRAANAVTLDMLLVSHDIRGSVPGQMRPHVRTVGLNQKYPPGLAAIEHHILPEKADCKRCRGRLVGGTGHEPATRVGEVTQTIFC